MSTPQPTPAEIATNDAETIRRHYPDPDASLEEFRKWLYGSPRPIQDAATFVAVVNKVSELLKKQALRGNEPNAKPAPDSTQENGEMKKFYVLVRESDTDKEVKRMGPMSERKAEKVENGLNINLNHDKYYTETVEKR